MQQEAFDVIVVGSGVAGGTAAQQFCEAGLRVLVLEAGEIVREVPVEPTSIAALSANQIQSRCYAYGQNTCEYFVQDANHPYCTPANSPFSWIRVRAVGGKSLLWAGHCYRMNDLVFKAASTDGIGEEWPISYEEIEPYYDKAERILQLHSPDDDLSVADTSPGSGANFKAAKMHLQAAFAAKGCRLVGARVSHSQAQQRTRKPCIHCGQTTEECLRPVNSPDSTLAAALKTGLLTLWTQSPVQSIITDLSGKATAVAGVRRLTGERFEVTGRVIFLCASALESTRILLNSTSRRFPNGLANSSGVVGHYLMDHVSGIVLNATCDSGGATPRENSRAGMFYLPRWQNLNNQRDRPFLRGYGYQGFIMRADHELLPCGRTQRASESNATAAWDSGQGVLVRLVAFGEMLPHYDNYVEIDREGRKDDDGIPVLRICCQHRENEIAMVRDMVSSGLELLDAAGAQVKEVQRVPWEPGLAIHEAGTCRMGKDPRTSALNRFNQSHDVRNLFVTDASCFPSVGIQNPALTIMALTIRACEHTLRRLRQGDI